MGGFLPSGISQWHIDILSLRANDGLLSLLYPAGALLQATDKHHDKLGVQFTYQAPIRLLIKREAALLLSIQGKTTPVTR